jgi:hypothetical protein
MSENASLVIAQSIVLALVALAFFGWAISVGMQVLDFILDLLF